MANSTDLLVEDFAGVPMVATLAFSWLKRTHLQPSNGRKV